MKRKILICCCLILIVISSFLVSYKIYEKKKQEKIIALTNERFNFFKSSEPIKNPNDQDLIYLQNILVEKEKNENININKVKQLISEYVKSNNLEQADELLTNEIQKYSNNINYTQEEFKKTLKNNVNKTLAIDIYNNNDFIKNLNKEKKKREEYIKSLTEINNFLVYLEENNSNYVINENTLIIKDDNVLEKVNTYNENLNLQLTIKKEENQIKPVINNSITTVPILCYHGILDNPWGIESLFVRVNEFEEQMKYLSENGYTPLFVSEIKNASNYEKPVIITFDDGYLDVYTNAFPILKKYNLKANLYMISGWINGDVYMNTDMTKEIANSSVFEIGSHTVNHKALATLSNEEIEYEVSKSKEDLEKMINKSVDVIAYPTGSFDQRVIEISSKYYKYALSTINGKENIQNLNQYSMRRIYVHRNSSLEKFKNLLN